MATSARAYVFFLATVPAICAGPAAARDWLVPTQIPTIQGAIDSADTGDRVLVEPGTYVEQLTIQGKALSLLSTGGAGATIIAGSAPATGPLLSLSETRAGTVVRGFTFQQGGDSASYGGAICAEAAVATITDNLFSGNLAGYGGALYAVYTGTDLWVQGNQFTENRAVAAGGAISIRWGAEVQVVENIFQGNLAVGSGGGAGVGGAIDIFDFASSPSSILIQHNILYLNGARAGGAIAVVQGAPVIEENTIILNRITEHSSPDPGYAGAGLYVPLAHPVIERNIVALNQEGYGLTAGSGAAPLVLCNDVWGNEWGDYYGLAPGSGDFSLDPRMCDFTTGNFGLAADSPCLPENSGVCGLVGAEGIGCATPLAVDEAGEARQVTLTIEVHRQGTGGVDLCPGGRLWLAHGQGKIEIFDVSGRLVWGGVVGAGELRGGGVTWRGERQYGGLAPSGMYFARLTVRDTHAATVIGLIR